MFRARDETHPNNKSLKTSPWTNLIRTVDARFLTNSRQTMFPRIVPAPTRVVAYTTTSMVSVIRMQPSRSTCNRVKVRGGTHEDDNVDDDDPFPPFDRCRRRRLPRVLSLPGTLTLSDCEGKQSQEEREGSGGHRIRE